MSSPPANNSAGSFATLGSAGAPNAGAAAVVGGADSGAGEASVAGAASSGAGAPGSGGDNAGAPSGGDNAGAPSAGSGGAPGSAGSLSSAGSGGSAGTLGNAGSGAAAGAAGNGAQGNLPPVTLHLAGDSTVMTYLPTSAQEGWGQELGQFFTSQVTIDNQALGGSSVHTFQDRWTVIVSGLKPGDFAMADFGINDSGGAADRSVTPADFKTTMSQMNTQTKAQQATFILVTPSALQYWSAGKETNDRLAPYVAADTSLGMSDGIPVVDLNAQSLKFLNMIGQTAAMDIYINGDKAHFTKKGATQMASFVVAELRRINSPLAAYLK